MAKSICQKGNRASESTPVHNPKGLNKVQIKDKLGHQVVIQKANKALIASLIDKLKRPIIFNGSN